MFEWNWTLFAMMIVSKVIGNLIYTGIMLVISTSKPFFRAYINKVAKLTNDLEEEEWNS